MDVAWVVSAMDDFFRRGREVFFSQGSPSQIVGRKMVVVMVRVMLVGAVLVLVTGCGWLVGVV